MLTEHRLLLCISVHRFWILCLIESRHVLIDTLVCSLQETILDVASHWSTHQSLLHMHSGVLWCLKVHEVSTCEVVFFTFKHLALMHLHFHFRLHLVLLLHQSVFILK